MADMREEAAIRVVDDEASVRHSWEFILESAEWTVRSYASAEAFLKLDDPHVPGCVVLDVQMPGMSGIELMRELASRRNRLPVIFATAHGDIDMAVQALKDGASDFLPKPVKADRLIAAIEKAVKADLDRRKAEDGIAAARTLWDTLTPREKKWRKALPRATSISRSRISSGSRRRPSRRTGARSSGSSGSGGALNSPPSSFQSESVSPCSYSFPPNPAP